MGELRTSWYANLATTCSHSESGVRLPDREFDEYELKGVRMKIGMRRERRSVMTRIPHRDSTRHDPRSLAPEIDL